jgi:DeoR/GlpR family transcriptional regulator of sugar metabolism
MTIRRDFNLFQKNNIMTRTHGGGVDTQKISFELFMGKKMEVNADAKKRIARKALEYISPGDTILLDTGTTVFHLTNFLNNIEDLTVVTPSLAVASNLFWNKSAKLIVLGGYVKSWSPDLIGTLTEQNVSNLNFKTAFLGADGIHPEEGFFCDDLNSSNVVKAIIKSSQKVVVMADSSKIGNKSLIKYGDFKDVDLLITDNNEPDKVKQIKNRVKTVLA